MSVNGLGRTVRRVFTIRRWHALALISLLQSFAPIFLLKSEAKDLTDVFIQGFKFRTDEISYPSAAAAAVAPAIAAALAWTVANEFPVASVAPAFTYRFDPTIHLYELSTGVPGPLFSERALTLGKGQLNITAGYSFIDFDRLNGTHLDNITSLLFPTPAMTFPSVTHPGRLSMSEVSLRSSSAPLFVRSQIDLQAHVVGFTLRYGITDNWDIGLFVPLLNTFLKVRNELVRASSNADGSQEFVKHKPGEIPKLIGFADSAGISAKAAGSATGIGDIGLRTKYQLWSTESGGAALGLKLQLPSGEGKNFHGADETHLSTFLYFSQILLERIEPRINIGIDFNADDVNRSAFLYTVGGTLLVGKRLALVVDFIGHDEFSRFPIHLSQLPSPVPNITKTHVSGLDVLKRRLFFPATIKRNDIANFTLGLRYRLGTSGSIFFGGVIPLNSDGFRSGFVPSGGIEYTF